VKKGFLPIFCVNKMYISISVHLCYFGAGKLPLVAFTYKKPPLHSTLNELLLFHDRYAICCPGGYELLLLESFATAMLLHQQMAQSYRSHRMGGT
jgi:hypothetical protein